MKRKYKVDIQKDNTIFTAYVDNKYHSEQIVLPKATKELVSKILLKAHTKQASDFILLAAKLMKANSMTISMKR